MTRTVTISAFSVALIALSTPARADTKPAVLWIPTSEVEFTPSGTPETQCTKTGLSGSAVAAGCLPWVDDVTTFTPHPDVLTIVNGVRGALSAYDVHVVTEPPPEYLPTFALLTSNAPAEESMSHTCSSTRANCSALARDQALRTHGSTSQCSDPDLLASAMFAVGLLSGLEGKENTPDDWMNYPPNFAAPPTMFVDECGDVAHELAGKDGVTPQPLHCTTLDHEGCGSGEQNSHADMLENLGPADVDVFPPVLAVVSPADGETIPEGWPLDVAVQLSDDSDYVGVRIVIRSDALQDLPGIEDGEISFCTSDLCDVNWLDGEPFKTVDSDWGTGEILGLPAGEYTITVEASDYDGNEAAPAELTVFLGGGSSTSGGDGSSGGEGSESGGVTTSTPDPTGPTPDPTGADPTGPNPTGSDPEPTSGGDGSGSGGSEPGGDLAPRGCSIGGRGLGWSALVLLAVAGIRRRL